MYSGAASRLLLPALLTVSRADSGGEGLGFLRSLRAAAAARKIGEGRMEGTSRADGRNPNQLRPFSCTGNPLNRAHGSARWAQGDTVVLAAVYGPKPGTRKGENPEKASIEVVWKPKTGQIGTRSSSSTLVVHLACCGAAASTCVLRRRRQSKKMITLPLVSPSNRVTETESCLQEGRRGSMR